MDKLLTLREEITKLASGGLCVAFSGGVDSALLLKLACEAGGEVHAVTVKTILHTPREEAEAREMAAAFGAGFHLLAPELPAGVLKNPPDRCYLCKRALFETILGHAKTLGLTHVLDGTNADDLGQYRPGLRALGELGIRSPLAEHGVTKGEVREMAAALHLTVAEKPSAPCLATRYPYDQPIDPARLPAIDAVEQAARALGHRQVRARVEGAGLRLEVPVEEFSLVLTSREALVKAAVDAGFSGISLDLEGFRSGSMDIRRKRTMQA